MVPDVIATVLEKTDVAAARRAALELAGFGHEQAGALSLIVTEAATNLLKHAGGGQIVVRRSDSGGEPEVEVIAIDKGPGITNPARCFEDGYSTAGSPGNGLGALTRLSSFYDYYSAPGKGTVLMARVGNSGAPSSSRIEVGAICAAYPGEGISGDNWAAVRHDRTCRLIMADGLGHGVLAAEASSAAINAALASPGLKAAEVVENCHRILRPTRGAAFSLADADFGAETLTFVGVGNVAGSIVMEGGGRKQLVSTNGTLGHEMGRTHPGTFPLPAESLVVMHSDGISASWGFEKYPGLFQRHSTVIAGVLFRDFRRGRDDATIAVARALKGTS
jgi:anti-sigma regulatory factor (Ser/Thr protein kinase)